MFVRRDWLSRKQKNAEVDKVLIWGLCWATVSLQSTSVCSSVSTCLQGILKEVLDWTRSAFVASLLRVVISGVLRVATVLHCHTVIVWCFCVSLWSHPFIRIDTTSNLYRVYFVVHLMLLLLQILSSLFNAIVVVKIPMWITAVEMPSSESGFQVLTVSYLIKLWCVHLYLCKLSSHVLIMAVLSGLFTHQFIHLFSAS